MENGYITRGQEETFVRKTLEVIRQYEKHMISLEPVDRHEVTLYINCLLGLLIIPQQSILKSYNRIMTNEQDWGVELDSVLFCPNNTCPKHVKGAVNEIARHLRNSLSHNNFFIQCNDGINVTNILFKDFSGKGRNRIQTFEYNFSIENLLKFIRNYYKPISCAS
jgi:HEPN pEK499 p136